MKKVMIIFMALITFAITAQNTNADKNQARNETRDNFTPEQKAELKAKKMTLTLDLNDSQQQKVKQVFLDMSKNKPARSNMKDMTDQQKFDAKSAMLDRRIAMKKQMKEILTEQQMIKWEKSHQSKRTHSKQKRNFERGRGR
jgi:ABC-type phosphate/phosphonate transport system substrate-binding protein